MTLKLSSALMAMSILAIAQNPVITADPSTSATYPVGIGFFAGEAATTTDPLGPFSGNPVEFKGWGVGGSQVSLNGGPCGACLVFDYHVTFQSPVAITSLSFTGDAFNGATFQLLDSNNTVVSSLSVSSGNVGHPVTYTMLVPNVVGTVFSLKLFDGSGVWTYVSNITGTAATDVTSLFSTSVAPFTMDRPGRDALWCTIVNLTETSLPSDRSPQRADGIAGPIEVALTNLSSNATLQNAAGFVGGSPYVILQPFSFPVEGAAATQVCFTDPSGGPITFVPKVFSGALQ
jgi:hypothetical protein